MFITKAELQAMRETMKSQAMIIDDITSVTKRIQAGPYGNPYFTYSGAVVELARKYEGTAQWGVLQTGNIIDIRSAFIIGQGISIFPADKKEDPADNEMAFVNDFLAFNDLNREMAQEFAKEAEIEGRWLGVFSWDDKSKMVTVRVRSWTSTQYTVVTDPQDYAWFTKILYKDPDGADQVIKEGDFVYATFAGRVHQPYQPLPKVAKCLGQIENLDKALWDWREINRLFASPVPHIQCDTAEQATYMAKQINDVAKNWKIKKIFAHTGKLDYASPSEAGVKSLENEIVTNAKMISGTTGVPVHFLGLPELMSGRGTIGTGLMQLVSLSTSKERAIWIGTYEQIIEKAMAIYNAKTGLDKKSTKLDPKKLTVTIPFISEDTWGRIKDVWLPIYLADGISLQTFLAQIPGVDVDEEVDKIEQQKQANMARMNSAFSKNGGHAADDNAETDGGKSNPGDPEAEGAGGQFPGKQKVPGKPPKGA